MAVVHSQWWCIEMPDEWHAEECDDAVLIVDPDEVGELCISAIKKDHTQAGAGEPIDDRELREFAADTIEQGQTGTDSNVAGLRGLYFEYQQDEEAWREWYLTDGATLLYASYNTDCDNAQLDVAVIDQMLDSLVLVDNSEVASPV